MTIRESAKQAIEQMLANGQASRTTWYTHDTAFLPIVRAHESQGKKMYDSEIVAEYANAVENRFKQGKIKKPQYQRLMVGVRRLTEMHEHGKLVWNPSKRETNFKLNEYFQTVVDEFLSNGGFKPKAQSDAMWISRKYFAWLIEKGHYNLNSVGVVEVQGFMVYCGKHMASSSVHNAKLYMKKLYKFLKEREYAQENYSGLFSFKVYRQSKLYPAASPEEISAILNAIDRTTQQGKRDYAMMLLGIVMGLRAIDIIKMRLHDIDWQKGEINIIQSKTGLSLALPLTTDVGKAIQDYILNVRPNTESDILFIRLQVPHRGLSSATAVQDLYDNYCKKAKITRSAFDGKGFHSLRRAVGKGMVTAGVSIESVAQVIGDRKIDSIKKYVALDSVHLKECALDFSGIEKAVRS